MKNLAKITIVCLFALTMMSSFWACSGSLHSYQAFDRLNPIEDLPEPTPDHNLLVQINNVADVGTSYMNKAELYINGKRIRHSEEVEGYQRDYHYHLQLKTGVYKIEAFYYAMLNKYEESNKITTMDGKVRIYPDQRTTLSITLDKKLNGQLKQKENFFSETNGPLSAKDSKTTISPAKIHSKQDMQRPVEGTSSKKVHPIKLRGRRRSR